MITRIEIDGFKSLRGFAMDLEPFTVLIGPNSAGKSNVLDAIALLGRLASMPLAEAFKKGRGKAIDQFSRHGGEVAQSIRFAVEFFEYGWFPRSKQNDDEFQSRFRYELTIQRRPLGSGSERLVARDERLRAIRREEDSWIAAHPDFAEYACYVRGGEDAFFSLKDERRVAQRVIRSPSHWPEEFNVPATHTALSTAVEHTDVHMVRDALVGCFVLEPSGVALGAPSERIDSGDLAPNASNLPTLLAELPAEVLGEIRADLVSLVPGIASFDVTPEGDDIRLDFELTGGDRLPARLVSAGTLRILALLTALRMAPRAYLFGIEEPENGIYPGRLRALLEVLRGVSTQRREDELRKRFEWGQRELQSSAVLTNQFPTQILLTTHSPVVLAALRAHPEHLRFVDMVRRNGERVTRVRCVGKAGNGDRARRPVSPREIDALLHAARSEEPEG